ncbi:hypothetical protein ACNI3K_01250 [Demequina sp. SO4-13]|uniref:hypothetical protein n=1 Tax=Demequina sp. SO4-13 TaxID=3401027 RepID=UPI003AF6B4EC
MNKGLMAVGAIAIAGLSAAVGWYGVQFLTAGEETPVAGQSDPPASDVDTVTVTFNIDEVEAQASGLFSPPDCGAEWSAEPTPANGVIPEVSVTQGEVSASATVTFTSEDDDLTAFLAQEGQLIITRDGVVVTPDWGTEFVPDLFVTSADTTAPSSDSVEFSGATLCDTAAELSAIWDDFEWSNATEEQIAERQQEAEDFAAENSDLPPGEYEVYAWTPVILGEPAAAARALAEEGLEGLAYLQYTAGYSVLQDDPRIVEHCTESETPEGQTELLCNVPQDVLAEVLTRDVPEHYVVDAPAAVAISEPATFTVE